MSNRRKSQINMTNVMHSKENTGNKLKNKTKPQQRTKISSNRQISSSRQINNHTINDFYNGMKLSNRAKHTKKKGEENLG
jgi:hypothetical protein